MHFKVVKKYCLCSILLLFCILNMFLYTNISYANNKTLSQNIEAKRQQTRAKINELKRKERIEIKKLSKIQSNLEQTKTDIRYYETRLSAAKSNLQSLQSQITSITQEHQFAAKKTGERLKQIYKGERISILHLIFAADDINTFLDRIYYQKRLALHDKDLLNDLRAKTTNLLRTKREIESQKASILSSINTMQHKKRQIAMAAASSQYLINKLRTDRHTYERAEKELAARSAMLERQIRGVKSNIKVTTGFLSPIIGRISSPFGWRRHPIFGSRSFHSGVDIAGPNFTPVKASNSGTVIHSGWYGGYGKVVIISHGNYKGRSTSTLYAHLARIAVSKGSQVSKGQVVGYEGTTGYSTGPHLHFEVRLDGKPTNPMNYIN